MAAEGEKVSGDLKARLEDIVRATPSLMHVMAVARELDLPDWLIFSGAIYQPVLNHLTGRDPDYGIKDYDLGYFDASDIGWDAEDAVIRRVAAAFDEPFKSQVEVRNQARVHVWFKDRFGEDYDPLPNTDAAPARFVAPAFSVGVRLEADETISVVAPFGLEDVFDMIIRPNPDRPLARGWARTVENARGRWPEIRVVTP